MAMNDPEAEFDRFLARSLAPPERAADRRFVDRVQRQVQLAEVLRARRARTFERIGIELLSLVALGCGLAAIASSSAIAESAGQVPHIALAGIMLVFALWVPLVAAAPGVRRQSRI